MKLSKMIGRATFAIYATSVAVGFACAQGYPGTATSVQQVNPLAPTLPERPTSGTAAMPSATGEKPGYVYGDKVKEGGWEGLAKLLDAIAPSVDTRVPLSPSEITRRIEGLIRADRLQEALKEVEARQAVEADRQTPGVDVQLMFLHARVLTELKRTSEAEAIYQRMTMRFPELPEPWNNLAVIYAQRGELEQARRAIEMAIMINPKYSFAQSNMGDIELGLALKAYQNAADAGAVNARAKIRAIKALIEEQNTLSTLPATTKTK
ncbi:tetratricopeptide repeat protein [Orrella sp. NBD-18]|uniref:Tetratricopeptide repeat protein n=1 Tax=Sheuella amnicola TaxID=2707330 RepID=A0A6B2R0N5_9BURK|nr:tetratricopeptide repeat protein [Sheuella amnicola]NDY83881.1 tetratricopeptide repeat protein [Sheuella amnicola]